MKIAQDTPDELVIDNVPWVTSVLLIAFTLVFVGAGISLLLGGEWAGGLLMGGLGGGLGAIGLAAFTERTQMWADRRAGTVALRRRTLLGRSEEVRRLDEVERAVVEGSRTSKGSSVYRPALELRSGLRLPLWQAYVSGQSAGRAVEAINRWLGAGT